MTVTYKGLDCIKDKGLMEYSMYHKASQAAISWASNARYGKVTVYFGVATIFVALVKHFWFRWMDRKYVVTRERPSGLLSSLVYVLTAYCRYFGYQPTPGFLVKFLSFPASVGNSLYAVLTSGYLLCFCLVPHFWYRACDGFGSPPLAVRAGVMATALTPFVFVLAGKSNAISMLTGIGYEKLNWLHQFVGVATLVLAIIHTIPFIHQALAEGGLSRLAESFEDLTFRNGIPPLVLLIFLCLSFRKEVRNYLYELSFHAHWMMGCGYFGTLMFHVYKLLDMQNYLWGTLAFWMAQSLYRVCTSGLTRSRAAEIQKLGDNTFQVTVHDIRGLKWKPGQHCFLRFPGVRIVDNHPFSIASVQKDEHLKFIIVPKKGLTRKLYNQLDSEIVKKRVLVDGPYGGSSRSVLGFDKVILFATGSGVTVTLPYLSEIANSPVGPVAYFVWVVKHLGDIEWIREELESISKASEGRISIDIFCADRLEEKLSEIAISGINVHFGKPNIKQVARGFRGGLRRRNLIINSGSDSMRRDVNKVAAEFQKLVVNGSTSTQYVEEVCLHSESFGW